MLREQHEDLIDLGAATAVTRGGHWGNMDFETGLKPFAGLSDD
jgi:hypothetical protein